MSCRSLVSRAPPSGAATVGARDAHRIRASSASLGSVLVGPCQRPLPRRFAGALTLAAAPRVALASGAGPQLGERLPSGAWSPSRSSSSRSRSCRWWRRTSGSTTATRRSCAPSSACRSRSGPARSTAGGRAHALHEYVSFIVLLGRCSSSRAASYVRGTLAGTPGANTGLLALGAVLASLIGTTGASMLLIRPLLRANSAARRDRTSSSSSSSSCRTRRPADAARRSAALPRVPAGRAVPLDAPALARSGCS